MTELTHKLLLGALLGYLGGAIGGLLLARSERAANRVGFGAVGAVLARLARRRDDCSAMNQPLVAPRT